MKCKQATDDTYAYMGRLAEDVLGADQGHVAGLQEGLLLGIETWLKFIEKKIEGKENSDENTAG